MCQILILSAFEHRRQALRTQRRGVGTLVFNGHALICRVEGVTREGASIVTSDTPCIGENVRLDLPGVGRFLARVATISGDRIGVEFVEKTSG